MAARLSVSMEATSYANRSDAQGNAMSATVSNPWLENCTPQSVALEKSSATIAAIANSAPPYMSFMPRSTLRSSFFFSSGIGPTA